LKSRRLVVGAGALALGIAVLAFAEFSSPQLGRALLDRAATASGVRLEASEFRLSILRGLSLGHVRAAGRYPGGSYDLTLDRIVFHHRLLPLLAGRLTVDRIRLERPRAVLIEAAGASAAAGAAAAGTAAVALPIALDVGEAVIDDGRVEMRARGRAPIVVTGLDLRLRDLALGAGSGGALGRLSGRGDFRAKEIALPVTRAREPAGTFRLSAGHLDVEGLRFQTDEGRFQTRLRADLTRLPFSYTLSVEGRPLDMNAMAGATGKGGGFGPAHLTLEAGGVGPDPTGLSGKGVLRLEAGTLPEVPLLAAVERVLGRTRLSGARYKPSETPFRIEHGRVLFDRFRLDGDAVGLEASGWSSLEGPLELSVAVRTPRPEVRIATVPPAVLDALVDEEGWVRIPLKVTGTRTDPRVSPDMAALLADARREGGKALAGRAADKLRDLLRP
jgi:AsmA-like C-terminal region